MACDTGTRPPSVKWSPVRAPRANVTNRVRTTATGGGLAAIDPAVAALTAFGDRVLGDGPIRRLFDGSWLGHKLHPMLTDLPIGFWTSAFALDLAGRDYADASDLCVAIGTLSAMPTVIAGLSDWLDLDTAAKRVGVVHATSNVLAVGLYGASWWCRHRGARVRGVSLAFAGATAATIGGALGGHLAFGKGSPRRSCPVRAPHLTQPTATTVGR